MKIDYQDKYISTLEDILRLRQEVESKSLLIVAMEENISRKICKISELEGKLTGTQDTITQYEFSLENHKENHQENHMENHWKTLKEKHNTKVYKHHQNQFVTPRTSETSRQVCSDTPKNSVPKKTFSSSKINKNPVNKKKKEAERKREVDRKKEVEKKKRTPVRKSVESTPKQEKELPPIEIDPAKYVSWSNQLQESLICWAEIIKSTHPGSLSHLNFTDKFRIEQAVHDFLSTRLHWRDIMYCAAINKNGIPLIAIPEDWADDFSDWFSERIGAGLLDSKVKEKKRNAKMQPVLGVKHGNEYQEFPDSLALVYPEFRSWLEIVRIRFPSFIVGFIHEEFVRDYFLSRNIAFKVVQAEIEKDSAWGVPSETEEEFFNSFLSMFHYHQNGGNKVHPKITWQIPKCLSLDTSNDKARSGVEVVEPAHLDVEKQPLADKNRVPEQFPTLNSGIFKFTDSQHVMRPFRKAVLNGTELFHWRDIIEDKFVSEFDDLLNDSNFEGKIRNAIKYFLNGSLLPAGLEPDHCFVCFSDDSDSEDEETDDQRDYGIPAILKDEFELWFASHAENSFNTIVIPPEREEEEEDFDDEQTILNK